jgi:Flp pilus assembly protein TadD
MVWGGERLCSGYSKNPIPFVAAGGALVVLLSALCFRQVALWKDDYTLFGYIDRITGGQSPTAKKVLGAAFFNEGKYQEAYDNYSAALALDPYYDQVNGYKGSAAAKLGRFREAAFLMRKQLQLTPGEKVYSIRLANVLILAGDLPGGARQGLENIRLWGDDRSAWEAVDHFGGEFGANMAVGVDLAGKHFYAEAEKYFREAVRLAPDDYSARTSLSSVLRNTGDLAGAERELAAAEKIKAGDYR